MEKGFNFTKRMEQSAVKTEIVTKYFYAWANVMLSIPSINRIGYIDLCSGPGKYEEGDEDSTPLIVLKKIIDNDKWSKSIVCMFNDENSEYSKKLEANVNSLIGVDSIKYKPRVLNETISESTAEEFMKKKIPCFSFIDPAGYDPLSLKLIYALTKDFGSDMIFFFNYNEINRWIKTDVQEKNMIKIFGDEVYRQLRETLPQGNPKKREEMIMNGLVKALNNIGLEYVLPFKFRFEGSEKTSHYLVFASKGVKGFNIMKEVLSKNCTKGVDGVRLFEYTHTAYRADGYQLSLLGSFNTPFDKFKEKLCERFRGKTLTASDVFIQDTKNTEYISSEYKDALKQLEQEGKIVCDRPATERKKGTLADSTKITFKME